VRGSRALHAARARLAAQPDAGAHAQPGQAAMLACLGSTRARARVLEALASGNAADVEVAQVYLRHRPLTDLAAIRALAHAVAGMSRGDAQVRALDTLAQLPLDDRESLDELVRLYIRASSAGVQRAVAGILVRADTRVLVRPDLVRTLQQHRIKSTDGRDMVDVLLRRLQSTGSDARAPAGRAS
jgi:hypothetical protein